jgi:hypothetical protein
VPARDEKNVSTRVHSQQQQQMLKREAGSIAQNEADMPISQAANSFWVVGRELQRIGQNYCDATEVLSLLLTAWGNECQLTWSKLSTTRGTESIF